MTQADTAHPLNILVLAPNPWDGPWMNRQQLFSRLGRHHRVVYSQGLPWRPSWSRLTLWRRAGSTRDSVVVDGAPPWLFRTTWRPATAFAIRRAARRWRSLATQSTADRFIAYLFHPVFLQYLDALSPDHTVYHAYDLFQQQAAWTGAHEKWERDIVRRADLCIASSAAIARHIGALHPRTLATIENAADFDAFAGASRRREEPPELAGIPHPRIGYAGALNRKIDFPLIRLIAARHRDWHFVLVGKVGNLDDVTGPAVEHLRRQENVHFFPFQPHHRIPAFVASMDVNAMWYRTGPDLWTEGIYPLKLHEYLAAGQPVVGTAIESIKAHSGVIRIPDDTVESWEQAIRESLAGDTPQDRERRQAVARMNDWDSRADDLERLLLRLASGALR